MRISDETIAVAPEMTTQEFRQSPELVSEMRRIFELPAFKIWIETFREDENPMNRPAPPDITPHGAYILLGEQTGWRQCLTRFLLGAVPLEHPPKQEEQTYAEPPLEPE